MNETTRQEGAAPQKHTDSSIDRPNTKNIRHLREHGPAPYSDLPASKVSVQERQAGVWKFGLVGASSGAVSGGGHTEPVYYLRGRHAPETVVRVWCRSNPGFLAERSLRSARTRLQETGSEFHDAIRTVLAEQGGRGDEELVTDGGTTEPSVANADGLRRGESTMSDSETLFEALIKRKASPDDLHSFCELLEEAGYDIQTNLSNGRIRIQNGGDGQ